LLQPPSIERGDGGPGRVLQGSFASGRAADLLRTRHPGTAVLVLSQYLDAGYAFRLLESFPSGVGYLLKDRVSQVAVLIDAVE
jgi:DNA-binding NarL/FixJ family response regulator